MSALTQSNLYTVPETLVPNTPLIVINLYTGKSEE